MNVNDYIDDRLSDQERREFEGRLKNDPKLAEELAASLELREALQAEAEPLPEAFYTRTRARFEAAGGGRRRIIGWTGVGIATSALLAFILLRPASQMPLSTGDSAAEPVTVEANALDHDSSADRVPPEREEIVAETEASAPVASDRALAETVERQVAAAKEVDDAEEGQLRALGYVAAAESSAAAMRAPEPPVIEQPMEPKKVSAGQRRRLDDVSEPERRTAYPWVAAKRESAGLPTRTIKLLQIAGLERCDQLQATRADSYWLLRIVEPGGGATLDCAIDLPLDGRPLQWKGEILDE